MVYEKTRSGDPDYDDKQPPEFHAGGLVVSAGDGVILSKVNGPIDAEGAHVNLHVATEDLDNRPAPGGTATKPSLVQDYSDEDTPAYGEDIEADHADVAAIKSSQASVQVANAINSGVDVDASALADENRTRTADVTAAKGENATAARKSSTTSKTN